MKLPIEILKSFVLMICSPYYLLMSNTESHFMFTFFFCVISVVVNKLEITASNSAGAISTYLNIIRTTHSL